MSVERVRIANCSGFYGDRFSAVREMVGGGPIDFLTGDYLAELTMFLLWRARQKDPKAGYAVTFLKQMEEVLGVALDRGIKIVTNAGGLNPESLATELRSLSARFGLRCRVAHVEGDDLMPRLDALQAQGHRLQHLDTGVPLADRGARPVTANAYLGAWGIVEALRSGADVVVCPRVTDASLVVGPAASRFGWKRHEWDLLAGAVVAGHLVECGAQVTGGNYAFFEEVPDLRHPGFPIAEVYADGSCVITKHPGTGGVVSLGTVTAQLLYEIDGPRYINPDVVARFDTVRLEQEGPNRVRVFQARGEPPPSTSKVCITLLGGHRNAMTFVLTGLEIEAKARLLEEALRGAMGPCESLTFQLLGSQDPDGASREQASALLRVVVKDADASRVGRAFSSAAVGLALASYPGLYTLAPPEDASPYAITWPTLVPASVVEEAVVTHEGARVPVAPAPAVAGTISPHYRPPERMLTVPSGPTRRLPLGTIVGARSGDKGGNANVGVWARSAAGYGWLRARLTTERFKQLVPEAAALEVRRYDLPNLLALNFVVVGLLGEGAMASTRLDPQAKSLGEYLRSRLVDLPVSLLTDAPQTFTA